ncbi:MAG: hypothetical protein KC549_05540, partial [Myxococcales bacterium]|nr:hypothetical protein [Myxococcales bacterium]
CDMATDGGVGYTMLRIEDAEALGDQQAAYQAACEAVGLEVIVPRTRSHFDAITAYNDGVPPAMVGVYPVADGAAGLGSWRGRCQGQPCDFWIADEACGGSNGDNTVDSALILQAGPTPDCPRGVYDDAGLSVVAAGAVICSTNDAAPQPRSCREASENGWFINTPETGGITGTYRLDADVSGPMEPYRAWCDQHTAGGGWTLALRAQGRDSALAFDSPLWVDDALLNPEAGGFDGPEAKLASFLTVPFQEYMIFMDTADNRGLGFFTMESPADSLVSVFRGPGAPSAESREDWLALAPGGRTQPFCNARGLNIVQGDSAVRVGMLGNNENDCSSADSFVGIGGRPVVSCQNDLALSTGVAGAPVCDGGPNLPGFARLFIR